MPWPRRQCNDLGHGPQDTVPVKCKLTVTRNSNYSTRSSKLKNFEYRVASRVVRVSSRVVRVSSQGDKEIYRSINFLNYMYMSVLLVCFWRQKLSSCDCRGGKRLYITLVNRLPYLNRLLCLSVDLLSIKELVVVHFRVTTA